MRKVSQIVPDQLDQSSLLLMYLADELPARQRAELDHRIKSDAALRSDLEALRQVQAGFELQMRHLDAAGTPFGHAALVRRISQAMRDHGAAAQGNYDGQSLAPRRILRFPVWAYPIAAAAAVALIFVARFAFAPVPPAPTHQFVLDPADSDPAMFTELQESFTDHNPTQSRSLESLNSAETELADIASMTKNENLPDLFNEDPSLNSDSNQ